MEAQELLLLLLFLEKLMQVVSKWRRFEAAFGFPEFAGPPRLHPNSFEDVRAHFELSGSGPTTTLTAVETGKTFHIGAFETPSVAELRDLVRAARAGDDMAATGSDGGLTMTHVAGDVRAFIRDAKNAGAVFQVASQFNCLEMVGPRVRPEDGISMYASDPTQGPACALCCPAATLFRNYFVNGTGQAGRHQLDLLTDVGVVVDNAHGRYWTMENGYCLPVDKASIGRLGERLLADGGERGRAASVSAAAGVDCGDAAHESTSLARRVHDSLRVGVHWSTSVLKHKHNVCQVFCSALPVSYSGVAAKEWEPFAKVVLDGAYDATLLVGATLAARERRRVTVYLTMLGGGAFGNRDTWIRDAIIAALSKHRHEPLDVVLVHYSHINSFYACIE